ncbi:MAG: hypothetical protein D4R73_05460 [Deltaproteobacteria bacterium]|nr:MAG: hypothetical protein D4R73_05460 [Deltaproteobacteria bacterium]
MNLAFLGDALDHWKGSLFEPLQRDGILQNFAVDPMASDLASWTPEDFSLFSTLLRIDRSQIIPHNCTLADRKSYFAEIRHPGDLFLDPDTGVATGQRAASVQHVSASEIATLLGSSDRLLAIYQHVRAQRVSDRVDAVCRIIRDEMPEGRWCSYESGTVAMIFVARKSERTVAVAQHFAKLLGRHATGRIRVSNNGA